MSSKIPSDLLVPRGNNGLLDSYPDMNYGLGVLEKRFMQDGTAEDVAGVPDGIVRGEDEGLGDLGDFMKEGNTAELSFIDVEADPLIQNLPEFATPDQQIQASWEERETPAIYAEHQKDLTAIPRIIEPEEMDEELLLDTAMKCARLIHTGHSIKHVQKVAFDRLGENASELKDDIEYLAEEQGLMGNVYVLASAYPNLIAKGSDWKKFFGDNPRYLLVDEDSKLASFDNFQGMKVVTEIPYKEALSFYRPLLQSTGRKLAKGDARTVLKKAFLSTPKKEIDLGVRPQDYREVDTVSMKEAKSQFASYTPEDRKRYSDLSRQERISMRKARQKIARSYRAGMLSKSQLEKLVSLESANEIETALNQIKLASHRGSSEYSGDKNKIAQQQSLVRSSGDVSGRIAKDKDQQRIQKISKKVDVIKQAITRGVRGDDLARIIKMKLSKSDLKIASPMLQPILKETNALSLPSAQVQEYSGTKFQVHQEKRMATQTKKISREEIAIQKMARWTRQQMSEGVVGKTLTTLLRHKFAPTFLKAAKTSLSELRKQHEGLSGHLYVDAAAYASPRGTTGCDEGGLKHRSNQLKFVMAMDRCGSCKFASQTSDGSFVCQKYNKQIITELPSDALDYQKEMIRLADATDAEQTASLFASPYDPNEFNLSNGNLDHFAFDQTASIETLSGVFFGGIQIEDEDE